MMIMLHGATDRGSTNFGDILYGNELYQLCRGSSTDVHVCYYNESEFFKKYTKEYDEKKFSIKETDMLVYIPGGYFSEACDTTIKRCLINFKRYMPFGLEGCFRKKRIAIVGLGAGNIHTPFLKWPLKMLLKRAELITVRDHLSANALQALSPRVSVENYGDMILSIDMLALARKTAQTQSIKQTAEQYNKKLLVVHYNHSEKALELFADALKIFATEHPEYLIVVAADSVIIDDEVLFERYSKIIGINSVHYKYEDPFELIELLNMSDTIVTCKLHLGVVSCILGKSVISVAEDYPKTSRFYEQIGETPRCVSLKNCNTEMLVNMLERYSETPITIPKSLIEMSMKHRERLLECLQKIEE